MRNALKTKQVSTAAPPASQVQCEAPTESSVGSMLYLQRTIGIKPCSGYCTLKLKALTPSPMQPHRWLENDLSQYLGMTNISEVSSNSSKHSGISTSGADPSQAGDAMPEPSLQRTWACGGACTTCHRASGQEHESLQTKRVGSSDLDRPHAVERSYVLRSPANLGPAFVPPWNHALVRL